jgi:AraC-like DNA-binding protein
MKPAFESLDTGNHSFLVRKFTEKKFSAPYHFHPEYELTLIVRGSGKRYVGSHIQHYASGDLVLLGSNLPHCWKTENEAEGSSQSIVIQFREDCMGAGFFNKPELHSIRSLLDKSNNGIYFKDHDKALEQKMIVLSNEKDDCNKFILLIALLHTLALTNAQTILNRQHYYEALSFNEKERINKVMAYIVDNFQHGISLNAAAALINMTTHAFCKYFKKITRKTFIEAVNDYRIDFAARQLVHTENAVAQIGYDSGFNDISNFYKTFKEKMKLSPLAYRKAFVKHN